MYMTPCPMVMWLFQPNLQIFKYCLLSGLVKFITRDPSLEENTTFFLKWFCCYLGVYLLQPGTFCVLTKWYRCQGRKCISALGERQRLRKISVGNRNPEKKKRLYICPGDFTVKLFQNLRKTFWLQEDAREVTLIPKSWKVLKIQKSCLEEKIKKG